MCFMFFIHKSFDFLLDSSCLIRNVFFSTNEERQKCLFASSIQNATAFIFYSNKSRKSDYQCSIVRMQQLQWLQLLSLFRSYEFKRRSNLVQYATFYGMSDKLSKLNPNHVYPFDANWLWLWRLNSFTSWYANDPAI